MKKLQLSIFVLALALGLSAHAWSEVNCVQDGKAVQLNIFGDQTLSLRVNGESILVKFDAFSSQAEHDFYSYTYWMSDQYYTKPIPSPIAIAQDSYGYVVALSLPHDVLKMNLAESFQAQLQYRDYDEDYDMNFEHGDQGPDGMKNGYKMDAQSLLNLTCNILEN